MKKSAFVLVSLFALGLLVLAQESDRTEIIFAGESNESGGTYCFGGVDARRVNALWHVAGKEWRTALADPQNEKLRSLLDGKRRESVRDGVTYYAVAQQECFFVPAPIKARVDLFTHVTSNGGSGSSENRPLKGNPIPDQPSGFEMWLRSIDMAFWSVVLAIALIAIGYAYLRGSLAARRKTREEYDETIRGIRESHQLELERMQTTLDGERAEHAQVRQEWELNNPERAGEPVIEGGLDSFPREERHEVATHRLQEFAAMNAPGTLPREWRVEGDVVEGVINGSGYVEYGTGEPQLRNFNNTRAFQALMEHIPTGERVRRTALWICCNGAYRDMLGGEHFIFTPNAVIEAAPLDPEEVARIAHDYWVRRGCPDGSPEIDWFRAEAELRERQSNPAARETVQMIAAPAPEPVPETEQVDGQARAAVA